MANRSRLEHLLCDSWPPALWRDVTVLTAVSGGADSVGLLRAMHAVRGEGQGQLIVAHFNHRLRAAADEDERLVHKLAADLGLALTVGCASPPQSRTRGAEAAARRRRYQFLRKAAAEAGARFVVTAHTADDQAETVLHRVLRGTGIRGLAGIPRSRRLSELTTVVRPLLGTRRQEIREYLAELKQNWRHDESNDDPRFTRNRLRNVLLPLLANDYNPRVVDSLCRLGQLAAENQTLIDAQVRDLYAGCVTASSDRIDVSRRGLQSAPAYLIREVILKIWRQQHWGLAQIGWDELTQLAGMIQCDEEQARDLPGGIHARVDGEKLVLYNSRLPGGKS